MRTLALLLAVAALVPNHMAAQVASTPRRHVTLQAGGFTFDRGDGTTALAAVRVDWLHNRVVRTEVGLMGSRPRITLVAPAAAPADRVDGKRHATFAGTDVSVQAQLPTPVAQPYVGLATGIFGYFEPRGGDRYFAPSTQALAGVRARVSRTLGLRGEVRFRFDRMNDDADNAETTLGLTWAW